MDQEVLAQIQKHIIKYTPVGESETVLQHYQKLVATNIDQSTLTSQMKNYNHDHLYIFKKDNYKFLVNPDSCLDGYYIDQQNNKKLEVDHVKQQIIKIEEHECKEVQNSQLYQQLNGQIDRYVREFYKEQDSHYCLHFNQDGSINIYMTAKNFNFKNFFGSEWNSIWKLNKNELKGTIKVNVHFYEEGNIQFENEKNIDCQLKTDTSDVAGLVTEIYNFILNVEEKCQLYFNDYYEQLKQNQFKHLRRLFPVNQQKMQWNQNYHKVIANLKEV